MAGHVVCAWCRVVIRKDTALRAISHGICCLCALKELSKIQSKEGLLDSDVSRKVSVLVAAITQCQAEPCVKGICERVKNAITGTEDSEIVLGVAKRLQSLE